jgi:hypothetical protein
MYAGLALAPLALLEIVREAKQAKLHIIAELADEGSPLSVAFAIAGSAVVLVVARQVFGGGEGGEAVGQSRPVLSISRGIMRCRWKMYLEVEYDLVGILWVSAGRAKGDPASSHHIPSRVLVA